MELDRPAGLEPITADAIGLFAAPLGRLVMATAQLDLELNFLIFETYQFVVQLGLAKSPPFNLGEKITLMIRLFEQEPVIVGIGTDTLASLFILKEMNELRRFTVHGALHGFLPGEDPSLFFVKADYSKSEKSYQPESRLISLSEVVNGAFQVTVQTERLASTVKSLSGVRNSGPK